MLGEAMDSGETQPVEVVDLCEKCGRPWEVGMWATCRGNPADHGAQIKHSPFPAFEMDGKRFADLGQIRAHERETMDRYRGGERVQPVIFRAFSQDRSNSDVNTFGRPPQPGKPNRSNIKLKRRSGE